MLTESELIGRVFTTVEVADLLGVGVDSVRAKVRAGYLKAVKPPGMKNYMVTGEDLWSYVTTGGRPAPRKAKVSPRPKPRAKVKRAEVVPQETATATKPATPTQKVGSTAPFPEIGLRYTEFFDSLGITQTEIAEKSGVDLGAISRMKSGKKKGTPDTLEKLHVTFNLNLEWLETGLGDMILE